MKPLPPPSAPRPTRKRPPNTSAARKFWPRLPANVYIQDLADLVAVRKGLSGYRFYPLYAIDLSTVAYT